MKQLNLILPDQITKSDIDNFVTEFVKPIIDGDAEALPTFVRAKIFSKILDEILSRIDQASIDEALRYGQKTFEYKGCSITHKEGFDVPDTSKDPEVANLSSMLKARNDILKLAYKNNGKATIYDPSTGEEIPVYPPKPSKQSLTLTLPK